MSETKRRVCICWFKLGVQNRLDIMSVWSPVEVRNILFCKKKVFFFYRWEELKKIRECFFLLIDRCHRIYCDHQVMSLICDVSHLHVWMCVCVFIPLMVIYVGLHVMRMCENKTKRMEERERESKRKRSCLFFVVFLFFFKFLTSYLLYLHLIWVRFVTVKLFTTNFIDSNTW